jgi:UDP-glucose 4-epimerase
MPDPRAKAARCLITGGLGYVGAWIAAHLAKQGHTALVLSRRDSPVDIGAPYALTRADLARQSPEELAEALPEDIDCLVHAASFNESFDPDYGRKALLVNALGTRSLLEALLLRSRRSARPAPLCLYLSTFHVYGRSSGVVMESDPLAPRNDYALTHVFGEEYLRMFGRSQGLPFIILRLSNGYGAPRTPVSDKWYLLLNDLCRQAVRHGRVRLNSSPALERDFVWLGDVAQVMEKLLARRDLAGATFNLASGRSVSIGHVARLVADTASRHLGREVALDMPDPPQKPPEPLRVDNQALLGAVDVAFHDRMEQEIVALLDAASGNE